MTTRITIDLVPSAGSGWWVSVGGWVGGWVGVLPTDMLPIPTLSCRLLPTFATYVPYLWSHLMSSFWLICGRTSKFVVPKALFGCS